ncbi:hypothetical protein FDECE_8332 [Fusarium decemcellulare]|nr:hypothetical protein FDECE_8332 [Fusarium decemcellulare]
MSESPQQNLEGMVGRKTRQVNQKLRNLMNNLQCSNETGGSPVHGLSSASITDLLERFLLWAGNSGALQESTLKLSLDHRLSDAPEVKVEILRQLEDISEATDDLLHIALGARPNRDMAFDSSEEEELSGLPSPKNIASTITKEKEEPLVESHMILEVISDSIGSLFRIGKLVPGPMYQDRFEQALRASDLGLSKDVDIDYVKQKHPKMKTSPIAERLGGAITKRREFIRYCREHRSQLGAGVVGDSPTTGTEKIPSISTKFDREIEINPYFAEHEEEDVVVLNQQEDGKNDLDRKMNNIRKRTKTGCLTKMMSSGQLRIHLAAHRTFSDQQLQGLEDLGRNYDVTFRPQDCPFCNDWGEELRTVGEQQPKDMFSARTDQDVTVDIISFKKHVATHQERLAILAVPRAIEKPVVKKHSAVGANTTHSSSVKMVHEDNVDRGASSFTLGDKYIDSDSCGSVSEET